MDRHAANHYPTSEAGVIASRPVASIAAADCVLFLWTTNQHLRIALGVLEAWGFTYKSNYVWGKDKISLGRWNRSKHELVLIGTRGAPPCPAPGTQWELLQFGATAEHSTKPEWLHRMIEAYFPTLPKIELNARRARPGWDAWGNEAPEEEARSAIESTSSMSDVQENGATQEPRRRSAGHTGGDAVRPPRIPTPTGDDLELEIPDFLKIGHPTNAWRTTAQSSGGAEHVPT